MPTYHRDDVAPSSIHPVTFVGTADPAGTPANNVGPHKLWLDTTGGKFVLKKRDAGDTTWDIILSLKHTDLTDTTTGDPHTQYLAKALGTTKGDILVYDGAAWVRLAAGTDGDLLQSLASAPDGVQWVAPSVISGAHIIQDNGVTVDPESYLDFVGFTLTDTPGTPGTTTVTNPALVNPMTTQDDLIIGGAAGAAARLAKGTDGQVLTVSPSTHHLVWSTPATGFANPMTTADDLIIGGVAGAATRLPKGSDGQVLTVDPSSHDLVWATPATPGTGTVTSVAFTATPSGIFDVSGSPIVGSGTIALTMDSQTGNVVLASPSGGGAGTPAFRTLVAADIPINLKRMSIAFQFGDGTNAIVAASEREQWLEINFACTIEGYSITADAVGSIVVDLWKDSYANYPPVVGDSITASAKPTLSAAIKATDSTLTGWTTSLARGDTLKAHVDSAGTVKAVTLTLFIVKT